MKMRCHRDYYQFVLQILWHPIVKRTLWLSQYWLSLSVLFLLIQRYSLPSLLSHLSADTGNTYHLALQPGKHKTICHQPAPITITIVSSPLQSPYRYHHQCHHMPVTTASTIPCNTILHYTRHSSCWGDGRTAQIMNRQNCWPTSGGQNGPGTVIPTHTHSALCVYACSLVPHPLMLSALILSTPCCAVPFPHYCLYCCLYCCLVSLLLSSQRSLSKEWPFQSPRDGKVHPRAEHITVPETR
jgi:hypothetical protein